MSETVQVNLRVHEDTKRQWKQYVDESDDFQTLTGLIRVSVGQQMKRGDGKGESQNVDVDLDPLKDEMGDIRNLIKGLDDEIDELKQMNKTAVEEPAKTGILGDLTGEKMANQILEKVPEEKQEGESTTDLVAQKTGFKRSAVQYHLEKAYDEGEIEKETDGQVVSYWKGDGQ